MQFDQKKLRLAFTVYAGMEAKKWQSISPDSIDLDVDDIVARLVPVLQISELPNTHKKAIASWGSNLLKECKNKLNLVLPFTDHEVAFLESLQEQGVIEPSLLTDDVHLQEKIAHHPLLKWRIKNHKRN